MRILLFGGSFDPPHRGHLRLFSSALRALRPDRAYLVPAGRSPLKSPSRAPAADRLALCRVFVRDLPAALRMKVRVCDWEARRPGPSYTRELLRRFRSEYPKAELYFLLGSDAAAAFPAWRGGAEIRRLARFVVGRRPGSPWPGKSAGLPEIVRLPGTFPDVSSTELRAGLLLGKDGGLSPRLAAAAERRGLYGAGLRKLLARVLSLQRYEHSLAVAAMAEELARRHGFDREKAALAGLLHDLGRAIPIPLLPAYIKRRRIAFPALGKTAANAPMLMHAHASEDLARRLLGVDDEEVLSAVRKHTLGAARMSPFDRLLFAADACSLDRGYASARRIRREARRSVERGFRAAVLSKLADIEERGAWKHPGIAALARLARSGS